MKIKTKQLLYQLNRFLIILAQGLLSSCGYHCFYPEKRSTISIPYITGDLQGQLTIELTQQIQELGFCRIQFNNGDFILKVRLIEDKDEIIGYRYGDDFHGKDKKLVADENRKKLTAEVVLIENSTGKTTLGPLYVNSSATYDYVDVQIPIYRKSALNSLSFSLGQLDSIEGAQDAAFRLVCQQLAKKIALILNVSMNSWDGSLQK